MKKVFLSALPILVALAVWELLLAQTGVVRQIFWSDRYVAGGPAAPPPAGDVPVGGIILIDSGSCAAGYTEVTGLDARFLRGTIAANADVGATGGVDSITPAGTNAAPSFTGSASSCVANHLHVQNVNTGATGGNVGYGIDTSTSGSQATALSTANPTGGSASCTPAGTVSSPAFTGNSQENRPAFTRVIFCKKD